MIRVRSTPSSRKAITAPGAAVPAIVASPSSSTRTTSTRGGAAAASAAASPDSAVEAAASGAAVSGAAVSGAAAAGAAAVSALPAGAVACVSAFSVPGASGPNPQIHATIATTAPPTATTQPADPFAFMIACLPAQRLSFAWEPRYTAESNLFQDHDDARPPLFDLCVLRCAPGP
ncbi:MAG: hypothetical protein FJX28_02600 [Alphaproteobacteria bacterium]|nr:hypothetical protein [Alphaproteobacteria bacterium]